MSGAEILGIASGIITLIDASVKLYHAAQDASGLPPSFQDAASRLPLVQKTLSRIQENLVREAPSPEAQDALRPTLEACMAKAEKLERIFRSVFLPSGSSVMQRYRKAFHLIPKSGQVQVLMDGILADLQLLSGSRTFDIPAGVNQEDSFHYKEEARGGEDGRVIRRARTVPMTFTNLGSGSQFIHTQNGDQSINFGNGPQLNGTFTGNLYFPPPQ